LCVGALASPKSIAAGATPVESRSSASCACEACVHLLAARLERGSILPSPARLRDRRLRPGVRAGAAIERGSPASRGCPEQQRHGAIHELPLSGSRLGMSVPEDPGFRAASAFVETPRRGVSTVPRDDFVFGGRGGLCSNAGRRVRMRALDRSLDGEFGHAGRASTSRVGAIHELPLSGSRLGMSVPEDPGFRAASAFVETPRRGVSTVPRDDFVFGGRGGLCSNAGRRVRMRALDRSLDVEFGHAGRAFTSRVGAIHELPLSGSRLGMSVPEDPGFRAASAFVETPRRGVSTVPRDDFVFGGRGGLCSNAGRRVRMRVLDRSLDGEIGHAGRASASRVGAIHELP
jgi:hypothetical protein